MHLLKTWILVLCLTALLSAGCNELPVDVSNPPGNDPEVVGGAESVGAANTQFGFNLFHEVRKTEQQANVFLSPFSVSVALAMTRNGAAAETERALTDTLQLQAVDPETINAGYGELRQALAVSDPDVTLAVANSLWARQGVSFEPDFLQQNTDFFGAEISTLDFNDPSASETINQWTRDATHGKIEKIVDDAIDPATVLFLINAIYFKALWQREFDPARTHDGTFYLANGAEKQVPMMRQQHAFPYYRGEGFQAVRLAYSDGQISFYIFLPDPDSDLTAFLGTLDAVSWEQWIPQFHAEEVEVVMPKFRVAYEKMLNDPLKALGMAVAFDSERADFSPMSPITASGQNLYIQEVVHKTFIDVTEAGTEAAGATSIGIGVTSLPPPPTPFHVDRPFFFAIHDDATRTLLFMGSVVNP